MSVRPQRRTISVSWGSRYKVPNHFFLNPVSISWLPLGIRLRFRYSSLRDHI